MSIVSVSKRGFAEYATGKVNQDAYVVQKDGSTGALFVGVFDGHGKWQSKVHVF